MGLGTRQPQVVEHFHAQVQVRPEPECSEKTRRESSHLLLRPAQIAQTTWKAVSKKMKPWVQNCASNRQSKQHPHWKASAEFEGGVGFQRQRHMTDGLPSMDSARGRAFPQGDRGIRANCGRRLDGRADEVGSNLPATVDDHLINPERAFASHRGTVVS